MATTKSKAQASSGNGNADEIRVPAKLPKIEGLSAKQVRNLYVAERKRGLGHVRVMTRLNNRARGNDVTPVDQLRRFTEPVTA